MITIRPLIPALLIALGAFVPIAGADPPRHADAGAADKPAHVSRSHGTTRVADAVNINTAGVAELMSLKGLRRKVAERIIEYRDAHGPFKHAEDVRNVDGFGDRMWEKNRARIVVR